MLCRQQEAIVELEKNIKKIVARWAKNGQPKKRKQFLFF
jgi:hypothetical protein